MTASIVRSPIIAMSSGMIMHKRLRGVFGVWVNMAVVTITSNDPMLMYWRMVFYGAADPGARLIPKGVDVASGLHVVCLIYE